MLTTPLFWTFRVWSYKSELTKSERQTPGTEPKDVIVLNCMPELKHVIRPYLN